MKPLLILILVSTTISINGCASDNGPDGGTGSSLNQDLEPIAEGDWYRPAVSVTWQWQLQGSINTSYAAEIYDVDLFDTPVATIQQLQASGKKVICYFSAGSYEDFREDKDRFLPEELGNTLDGWDDERWLDVRSSNVQAIMQSRLDLAQEKGCDGVEPDNMTGYANNTSFDLTANDQLAFNKFIANEAHGRGVAVGLKNDLDQVDDLVDYYDFSVNEQCFEYSECSALFPFISNNKPVLNAEYLNKYVTEEAERNALCTESLNNQFSTLILPLDLDDEFRISCL